MSWTPFVGALAAVLTLCGSIFGSYLAVQVMLARVDERLKAVGERMDRHSNRLGRLEDRYFHRED